MAEDAPKRNTTLSLQARYLLNKEEGNDVDFKRNRSGLKSEDLVAFANSPTGGTILIGVDEEEDATGKQRGKVVGCKIGDGENWRLLARLLPADRQLISKCLWKQQKMGSLFTGLRFPVGNTSHIVRIKGSI